MYINKKQWFYDVFHRCTSKNIGLMKTFHRCIWKTMAWIRFPLYTSTSIGFVFVYNKNSDGTSVCVPRMSNKCHRCTPEVHRCPWKNIGFTLLFDWTFGVHQCILVCLFLRISTDVHHKSIDVCQQTSVLLCSLIELLGCIYVLLRISITFHRCSPKIP